MTSVDYTDPPVSWRPLLSGLSPDLWHDLAHKVGRARTSGTVYPPAHQQFAALAMSPEDVRVVILGQDPYHGQGQAMGLSFSVPEGIRPPPSLANIFREIQAETGRPAAGRSGDLTPWRDQGVLLLNTVLTVAAGSPRSHRGWGWERVTDCLVSGLSAGNTPIVFMLWGRDAQAKAELIDESRHLVLCSPHPSPYSARTGFFGNGHFQKANIWLQEQGHAPINW